MSTNTRKNWTQIAHGTEWTFGNDAPKRAAIAKGSVLDHTVFLEQVTDRGRRFASYPSVQDLTKAFGTTNAHLFEIIRDDVPVKLYLDIEYVGEEDALAAIFAKLQAAYQDVLNFQLDPSTLRISCASGQGEAGKYVGQTKHSYHVVVDNGYAFKHLKQARTFVNVAFAEDDRVDKAPYGSAQSFKLIYSSKLDSPRVQLPQDGYGFQHHMVTCFQSPPALYSFEKLQHFTDRTIRGQTLVPAPVASSTPVFVTDDVDVHSVRTLLQYFPNGPSKPEKQPFEVFLTVACVCVNEGEPFSTFEAWASGYAYWSREKSRRIWDSLTKRLDGYDIRTLRAMLHKARPSVLMDIQSKYIQQCMLPTIDFAQHEIDTFQYCEPRMESWIDQAHLYKNLMIRGAMGSGKTYQILETIKDLNPTSVLVITPRQLFARSMVGTLRQVLPDLQIYKDLLHKDRACPRIVCQLESLWTLDRTYDMVICDEAESILHQFSSPTIKEFERISNAFQSVIVDAKTVIWTDAFLGDRTLLTCVNIDPQASRCFINNTWIPQGRRAYCAGTYKHAKPGILRAANHLREESNVVVCASRVLAKEVEAVLKSSGPTALVSSESSDELKKELEDVNGYLRPFRHFVYTSAITVGTSYDRRDHFDNLLMYTSACANNVRDSIQASMRVRHIGKRRLIYGSYPRYYGCERSDVMSRGRLRAMLDGREKHAVEFDRQEDKLWGSRHTLAEWQKTLWVHNHQENNVSAFLHHKLLRAYLVQCGYELMDSELSVGEEVQAHIEAIDYYQIPDVNKVEHNALRLLVERGQASADDKLLYLKGKFRWEIVRTADDLGDLAPKMFETYARDQLGIERRIMNHKAEKQRVDDALNIFMDNTAEKAEAVRGLCQQLGILDTCAIGAMIERSVMEKSCSQVVAMRSQLKETFDLRLREAGGKRATLKRGLELMNSILHKHGFTEIAAEANRKQARVAGRKKNVTGYTLQESSAFPGFARFL